MPLLARRIERALVALVPRRPRSAGALPANDNASAAMLAAYLTASRDFAGDGYAPAHTRQWWLP